MTKLIVEMQVKYVQATPEQEAAYNRAMKLLGDMAMRLYLQQEKEKKTREQEA